MEWSSGEPLLGANPHMASAVPGFVTLEAERVSLGERVAALGYAPVVQEYLKKGSPQCLRAKLWAQVLGSEIKGQVCFKHRLLDYFCNVCYPSRLSECFVLEDYWIAF